MFLYVKFRSTASSHLYVDNEQLDASLVLFLWILQTNTCIIDHQEVLSFFLFEHQPHTFKPNDGTCHFMHLHLFRDYFWSFYP